MNTPSDRVLKLAVPSLIVIVWWTASHLGWWPRSIIASPIAAFVALVRLIGSGELFRHTWASLGRLILGTGVGVALGVTTASLVALVPAARHALRPTLDFLAPIPVLAWIPLFIVLFGFEGARTALIASGTGLILYASTLTIISDTKSEYIDLARMYEKDRVTVLLRISLPSGAWSLFGALRIAVGLSWVLLLASELIASSSGLGWLIWDSRNFSRADEMVAAMLWVGLLGFAIDRCLAVAQARVTAWRPTFGGL